jgi:hypothetical protein
MNFQTNRIWEPKMIFSLIFGEYRDIWVSKITTKIYIGNKKGFLRRDGS